MVLWEHGESLSGHILLQKGATGILGSMMTNKGVVIRLTLTVTDCHWLTLNFIGWHWLSQAYTGLHWLALADTGFQLLPLPDPELACTGFNWH